MKHLITLVLLALPLAAADITITVKNDAGATVSTTTITTSNAVLAALNDWRGEQILTPATKDAQGVDIPAVLRYPTLDSLMKGVLGGFVRSVVGDRMTAVRAEQTKIETSRAEAERLKAALVR